MRMSELIANRAPRKAAMILAVLAAAATIPAGGALAVTRYVSNTGIDTNRTCLSVAAPCLTFDRAHNQAEDGDAITCLDPPSAGKPEGFGKSTGDFTVTKTVTIDCALGGADTSSSRIVISAPGKTVRLQNLAVNSDSGFGDLIEITAAAVVHLENVRVTGSINRCLYDRRFTSGKLTIVDSVFRDCASVAILFFAVSGNASEVTLDNVRSYGSAYGLAAGAGAKIAIKRSVFSGNSAVGIAGDPGTQITVDSSTVTSNGVGIESSSSIRLSNNNIAFNTTAISGVSGTYGNNRFTGNGSIGTAPTAMGAATSDLGQQ